MNEVVDLTACIAKGKIIRVEDKEYEIKFTFRAIRALEEKYENLDTALDSFINKENLYEDVLNFLYAACGEKYNLKKSELEEWISISTAKMLYYTIFEAILFSIGTSSEEQEQGEV